MTLSPDDDRRVIARPDLPAYPLNQTCPRYNALPAVENHHLWRRSTGSGFAEAYWVELSDGTILPNRIMLSNHAHREITDNEAHIKWLGRAEGFVWMEKNYRDEWELVRYISDYLPDFNAPERLPEVTHAHVSEGEECPTCHRRIPHAKKPSSPKTKVTSVRIPVADAETFDEMVDAAAEHLGLKSKPHHKYWTMLAGLALVLQSSKKELAG